jgi:hypothetical protein
MAVCRKKAPKNFTLSGGEIIAILALQKIKNCGFFKGVLFSLTLLLSANFLFSSRIITELLHSTAISFF